MGGGQEIGFRIRDSEFRGSRFRGYSIVNDEVLMTND
jgi:hypothetical protein